MNDIITDKNTIELVNNIYNRINTQRLQHVPHTKGGVYIYYIVTILLSLAISYYMYHNEYNKNKKKVSFSKDEVHENTSTPPSIVTSSVDTNQHTEYEHRVNDNDDSGSITSELSNFEY